MRGKKDWQVIKEMIRLVMKDGVGRFDLHTGFCVWPVETGVKISYGG